MKLSPLAKEHAEQIASYFKPLENKHIFQFPATMDTLMVTHITIAPSKGVGQDEFKFSFQTGVDLMSLVDKYKGTDFAVLVIANILSVDNIPLTQPYFFDIRELNEQKINGFIFPPQFS